MSKDKFIPDIRFYGFAEDWQQRKFHEIGTLNRGKSKHRPRNDERLFGGKYPFIQTGDVAKAGLFLINNNQTYSEFGIQQSKLWNEGTLLITIAANIAKTSILGIKAAFPDSIIGFESDNANIIFIKNFIDNASDVLNRKAETSSQANLNLAKLSDLDIILPSLEEQVLIGDLFKKLDETITLQQQLLNDHKQLKKAMLQKMFPQKGETVPRVRFAGFTDNWEEKELSKIAMRYDNLRVPITASDRVFGSTPYYGANGIQDCVEGYTHDGEFILVAEDGASDLKNYPVQYVSGKIWVNNHAHVLSSISRVATNQFLMNSIRQTNIEPFLVGGGRAKLNAEIMMKIKFFIPTFEEQIRIGNLFKQLDETIDLHQNKLETYQELKRAMLQKMFV